MTDEVLPGDGESVMTLQALIRARMDERGWTYGDLERRADGRLSKGRWQQLGAANAELRSFPDPSSMKTMSEVLEVDVTAILFAAAQSVGLGARRRGPELAQLLPAGTDLLSPQMRDAILTLIRAAVSESLAQGNDDENVDLAGQASYRWPKATSDTGRNIAGRTSDSKA